LLAFDEAAVLLAALAFGQAGDYASFREDHQHAEHVLKQTGLVHGNHGPYHARLSKDVMVGLRYCDDQHIADEGSGADSAQCDRPDSSARLRALGAITHWRTAPSFASSLSPIGVSPFRRHR
jgi:hypothetical protein